MTIGRLVIRRYPAACLIGHGHLVRAAPYRFGYCTGRTAVAWRRKT